MTNESESKHTRFDGNAGTQRSFLERCGVLALLDPSGALRNTESTGTAGGACAPERSQPGGERKSCEDIDNSALCSRAPEVLAQQEEISRTAPDWKRESCRLIASLHDDASRCMCEDFFEETAAFIEYCQNQPRQFAEQQAFALLLEYMHRAGIEVRVGS